MSDQWVMVVSSRFTKDVGEVVVSLHEYGSSDPQRYLCELIPVILPDGPVEPSREYIRELLVSLLENM